MPTTTWSIGHKHSDIVGPRFVQQGTVIAGLDLRVSSLRGLMDLRLRLLIPETSQANLIHSDWITHYSSYDATMSLNADIRLERILGLDVRERAGSGLIDVRLVLEQSRTREISHADWAIGAIEFDNESELRVPSEHSFLGVYAKEDASEGLVDLQLIY